MSAGQRLGVVETSGNGPPVVLLHGFGGCAGGWEPVQKALDRPSLAFDLPGHGKSLNYAGFGNAAYAARAVIGELDHRGVTDFHLVGHSMGGAVAALMALRQPKRVSSVTLLAPGGLGRRINAPLLRAFGEAVRPQELEAALKVMVAPNAIIPAELVQLLAAQRSVFGQCEALRHIASCILTGEEQGVIDPSALAGLAMPVTAVWGSEDRMLAPSQLENCPAHFTRVLLQGRGHMLAEEALDDVVNAISQTAARRGI